MNKTVLTVLLAIAASLAQAATDSGSVTLKDSGKTAVLAIDSKERSTIIVEATVVEYNLQNKFLDFLSMASVNGSLVVKTPGCGRLEFYQTKVGLFCKECVRIASAPGIYPQCELSSKGAKIPEFWQLKD